MSIVRIAVTNHLRANPPMTIRQLLSAAYYKKHSKPMPERSLDEDVRRWEAGENNHIMYLYDYLKLTGNT